MAKEMTAPAKGLAGAPKGLEATRERSKKIFKILARTYPDAKCSLDHVDPLELLVATILSAQCTDERVNKTTPALFKRYRTAKDFATAKPEELQKYIQSCGFYQMKAKNIMGAAKLIVEEHGGKVPGTLEELVKLPGVGRKTANVILGTVYDTPGVVVDTHCGRLARRLGFTKKDDPTKVEHDLMKVWPQKDWSINSHLLVFHGRSTCIARAPVCSKCPVRALCPFPETREGRLIAK
jgi:endonuclease-3